MMIVHRVEDWNGHTALYQDRYQNSLLYNMTSLCVNIILFESGSGRMKSLVYGIPVILVNDLMIEVPLVVCRIRYMPGIFQDKNADMHLIYGAAHGNASVALRLYQKSIPFHEDACRIVKWCSDYIGQLCENGLWME
ncbi:hypothetical protein TNCV_3899151 [Trichonephila clavipes]|nr:hypothetical protein TNCV_3899151 [Trichonephila clavipes]